MAHPPIDSSAAPPARLDSLTGARFVAALGVFFFHASGMVPAAGFAGTALALISGRGAIGVQFFFVLSGFVLAWSWQGGRVRDFYRRRFARIMPAYWVALVLGVTWVMYLSHDPQRIVDALPAVVGVQSWIPDPWVYFGGAGVEWSVSVEIFFYLLFPVLLKLADSRTGKRVLAAVAVLLTGVVPGVVPALASPGFSGWFTDVLPLSRLGDFACGLLLALAIRDGRVIAIRQRTAALLLLGAYVLLTLGPTWLPARPIMMLPILLAIAALAQADLRGARTWLSTRIPVRLGEWSYCFYLLHQMTLQVVITIALTTLAPKLVGPVWLASSLGAAILLAGVLHRFVERPLERRLKAPRSRSGSAGSTALVPSRLPAAG